MSDHDRQIAMEEARAAVDHFVARFEPEYRRLACYAALPLVLTPELLNFLRVGFLRGSVAWVAEVDLLLSDLCRPIGYEQYAMDQAVRAYLLGADPQRLSPAEARAAAAALLAYLRHQERAGAGWRLADVQAQQWSAMAYLDEPPAADEPAPREEAVRQIARQLAEAVSRADATAQARLASVVESLREEIAAYPALLDYARQVSELLVGEAGAVAAGSVLDVELPAVAPPAGETPDTPRPSAAQVEYVNLDIHISGAPAIKEATPRQRYRVTVSGAQGEARRIFALEDSTSLAPMIERLLAGQADGELTTSIGRELFALLFADETLDLYEAERRALATHQRFWVRLSFGAGTAAQLRALRALPWELLHDPERGYLALDGASIVRYVQREEPPPEPVVTEALKVLLTAAGGNLEQLDAARKVLAALAPRVEVITHPHLTGALLRQGLADKPHIWHHFGGAVSSGGSPALLLVDHEAGTELRGVTEIAALLRDSDVRLVVLHAADRESIAPMCELAEWLTEAGVPAVIALQSAMAETAVATLWSELYLDLVERLPIDVCIQQGRTVLARIAWLDEYAWAAPVLWTSVAGGRLFAAGGATADMASPREQVEVPPRPEYPAGALRWDSPYYVERAADAALWLALERREGAISLIGPRQSGKTSMLVRALHRLRRRGARTVVIDMQTADAAATTDLRAALRFLLSGIVARLGLEHDQLERYDASALSPIQAATDFIEYVLLPRVGDQLVLAIDEADLLIELPYHNELFGMFRYWVNLRAQSQLFERMSLVLILSLPPWRAIDGSASPYNVDRQIHAADFTLAETRSLNGSYRRPLSEPETEQLHALVGGHPYLTSHALYLTSSGTMPWSKVEAEAAETGEPFRTHLMHQFALIAPHPVLMSNVLQVLQGGQCSDERAFEQLKQLGWITGDSSRACTIRNSLYDQFLRRQHSIRPGDTA